MQNPTKTMKKSTKNESRMIKIILSLISKNNKELDFVELIVYENENDLGLKKEWD